jgi:hypothetical protein
MAVTGSLFIFITAFTLLVVLGLILVVLLVILLCRRHALWQALKNLATAVTPFLLAVFLWALIHWPPHHPLDLIALVSVFVLVLLSMVEITRFIVRSARSR